MCFSHDPQCGLGGGQLLVRSFEFAGESGDLGLLGGEFADFGTGFRAVEDTGITLFAPFADQRGVEAFAAQVRAASVALAGLLVRGQVGELVGGAEGASLRAVGAGMRGSIRSLSSTGTVLEIVIVGLIRISPCRWGCCEPLDSTQPDTQGGGEQLLGRQISERMKCSEA